MKTVLKGFTGTHFLQIFQAWRGLWNAYKKNDDENFEGNHTA
jgi:hypothetical protein